MRLRSLLTLTLVIMLAAVPSASLAGQADYDRGVAYLRAGKAGEAIKILEPLRSPGGDPYIEYHLGIAYYQSGRLDDAKSAFEKTLALSEKGASGDFPLAVGFSNLGVEYYRAGELDKASACLGEALRLSPDDGDSRYYLGLVKMEAGDYPGALSELERAGELLDGEGSAVAVANAAGMAHYRSGNNEAAAAGFARALEMDPGNIEALYYLGQINYKERGYAAARTYFDRIAHAGASDEKTRQALFTTFFNMGVDFQDRGKSGTAAEMFERAALLNPDDAETHYYLGYNLMAVERYEEAVNEFRQALDLDPGLGMASSQMEVSGKFASEKTLGEAASLMASGEYYAALPLYRKALSLDPSSAQAKKGVRDAGDAVKKDTGARISASRGLLDRGEYLEAKRLSDELTLLNPDSPDVAALSRDISEGITAAADRLMIKAREDQGRGALGEAAKSYTALLSIDPGNTGAREGIASVNSVIAQTRSKASRAAADGLLMRARAAYKELLGYLPGDPDAVSGLRAVDESISMELARRLKDARESFGAEDYTMAAYHAGRAAELDPGNADAAELRQKIKNRSRELVVRHLDEGDAHMEEGLREKASKSYEAALLLDPDNEAARKGLEKSRVAYAPAGSEEEVRRLYLKGVEHYTQGELEFAVEAWREVLKIDPANEKAASSIKRAEEKMRQTEEAPSQAEE